MQPAKKANAELIINCHPGRIFLQATVIGSIHHQWRLPEAGRL